MLFPKIVHNRKKSILAAEILLELIHARYSVGDKLPPERVLALEMNISRTTLREAIAALQLMGIVTVRQSQGAYVTSLHSPDARKLLKSIFDPRADPFSIVDSRIAIEPGISWLATTTIEQHSFDILAEDMRALREALEQGNQDEYTKADQNFHLHIAMSTQNEHLVRTLEPLLKMVTSPLWRAMKSGGSPEHRKERQLREHMLIFDSITRGDARGAQDAMREHLISSKERLLVEIE